jgi:hypothetical protein
MIYACCNENRKAVVLGNPTLNGIDYLEVLDPKAVPLDTLSQQTLLIHCLNPVPTYLGPTNVLIVGGESITGITARWIAPALASTTTPPAPPQATAAEAAYFSALPDAANVLIVRTSASGDFSPYTLRLVNYAPQAREDVFDITEALTGFDPQLS